MAEQLEQARPPSVRVQNPAAPHLASYLEAVASIDKRVTGLVEKGATHLLLYAGTVLFVVAVVSRVQIAGVTLVQLSTAEFITLTIEALVLVGIGSLLRWYQFRTSSAKSQEDRAFAQHVFQSSLDAATRVIVSKPVEPPI